MCDVQHSKVCSYSLVSWNQFEKAYLTVLSQTNKLKLQVHTEADSSH